MINEVTAQNWKMQLDVNMSTPLYRQIATALILKIKSGQLESGAPLPDERTLAGYIDVTRPTLRKALALLERDGFVSREQGRGTFIEEPSAWQKRKNALCIGLISWERQIPIYQQEIVSALCLEIMNAEMEVKSIDVLDPDFLAAREVLNNAIDGVIALPAYSKHQAQSLASLSVPKVIVDMRGKEPDTDYIVIDSQPAIADATRELVKLGHTKIAFIGALLQKNGVSTLAPESEFRFGSYRRALEEAGLPFTPDLYYELPFDPSAIAAWIRKMPTLKNRPSALIAFDDIMGNTIVEASRMSDLRIPDQLSVVGFGNVLPGSKAGQLATGEYDVRKLASTAVKRIGERIRRGGISGMTLSIESKFKTGHSIGKPGDALRTA
jgi:GntR family transcriptional regulator of arabinose operon